jgi:hypothetical protein
VLEILATILIGLLAVVGVVLAIAARRPDTFQIARTARIAASREGCSRSSTTCAG